MDIKQKQALALVLKPGDIIRTNLNCDRLYETTFIGVVHKVRGVGEIELRSIIVPGHEACSWNVWPVKALDKEDIAKDVILELLHPAEGWFIDGNQLMALVAMRNSFSLLKEYVKAA